MDPHHRFEGEPTFTPGPDQPFPEPLPGRPPIPEPLPPDWWRCLRRGPVSGRYEGHMTGPVAGRSVLDLRVDIDPRHPNSPVMDRVSGDFYNVYYWNWPGRPPFTWRMYRESWIVDAPVVTWSRCWVEISGTVRYWKGLHKLTTIHIRIPWQTFSPAGPAQVTFTEAGGSTFGYSCPRQSDCFRSINLEVDVASSVNTTPLLPSYDTHAHATRPPGLPQRVLTVEEAYREAGICVTIQGTPSFIDDSAPGFATWSDDELHDVLETHFSTYTTAARWQLWGAMVGRYDNSGVAGIMFDYGTAYGGPGRSPERQGFAVFRGHPIFSNLPAGLPANQAEADTLRYFLYVWVHEAGHAFNFLHSWDKGRPDALSWMNYPQYVTDFWGKFEFRFDDEELIHLRHGDRSEVIFGGDPWSTGSHLETPPGAMAQMEGSAPVELVLRSQGHFAFMEPVVLEFRLRNLAGPLPVEIDARLQPEFGRTAVYIQRPDGQTLEYRPIISREGTPELRTLGAGSNGGQGADRYSENVALTFDQHGFIFDRPGRYLIRAAYQSSPYLFVLSKVHELRVGVPLSREEDQAAQDFFTQEVGMSLYLRGSQSPFLRKGMEQLEEIADRFPDSPVGAKAALVVAESLARPFFRIKDLRNPKLVQTHSPEPKRALALTEPALAHFREGGNGAQNVAYRDLVVRRVDYLMMQGQKAKAKQELTALRNDLQARGVKEAVLEEVKGRAERL
jgi:hypothetical protein